MTIHVPAMVALTSVEKLPKAFALCQIISTAGWGTGAQLAGWWDCGHSQERVYLCVHGFLIIVDVIKIVSFINLDITLKTIRM